MTRRPEVLAPAGDEATLRAAVAAGADAVYFGVSAWNARARATNFSEAGLPDTMAYLHAHGCKGYLALNTLVFDRELPAVEAVIRAAAAAGVDALIVQDLGLARLAHAVAPGLPLHASTQMTCTDAGAVALARSLGVRRVVLARELSLDDIAAIARESDVELEVFVHGALCIAYSGQCLTSEAIGGRSANRGACAQSCRLPYDLVVDGAVRALGDRAYLLSPEDLEAARLVPRLAEIGVASLKIEGRLKGPDYVSATTRLYRAAAAAAVGAGAPPDEGARETALQMYSRGSGPGFLAGVDHQRLVDGRGCEHRGLEVGTLRGQARVGREDYLVVRTTRALAPGDGLVVEGGRGGVGEVGGRIWKLVDLGAGGRGSGGPAIGARNRAARRAGNSRGAVPPRRPGHGRARPLAVGAAGAEVGIWLGPDVAIDDLAALVGHRVFRTSDPAAERRVRAVPAEVASTLINVMVTGAPGQPARFVAVLADAAGPSFSDAGAVSVASDVPLASGVALDMETARAQLGRLGGTRYQLADVSLALPAGVGLPVSALNRARRALVAALDAQAPPPLHPHAPTPVTADDLRAAAVPTGRTPPPGGLFVLCRNLAQARAALAAGADGVYLDILALTGTGEAFRALRAEGAAFIGVAPPRIRKPGEEKIDRFLAALAPDGVLVRGLGALGALASAQRTSLAIGDFSLNVTNRLTAAEVLARGADAFTPAFDLDGAQLRALLDADGGLAPFAEVVVHHPMPLFHMEHCLIAAELSQGRDYRDCGRPCEHHQVTLRDRAGVEHPVEADVGCRNTVFHGAAQSAADLVPALRERGVRRLRIELVREPAAEVGRIVAAYRALLAGRKTPTAVWQELRTEGGYGVVRGSLRVLGA